MLKQKANLQLMEKLNSTHFNDSQTFADYEKIVQILGNPSKSTNVPEIIAIIKDNEQMNAKYSKILLECFLSKLTRQVILKAM